MVRTLAEMTRHMNLVVIIVCFATCWFVGLVLWIKGSPFDEALEFALTGLVYGSFFMVALLLAQFFAAIACGNHWSGICPY